MLWLFKEVCFANDIPMPKAMFIDEGYVFDEIWDLVNNIKKLWGVQVDIAQNTDVSDKAAQMGDVIQVADLNERNSQESTGFTALLICSRIHTICTFRTMWI